MEMVLLDWTRMGKQYCLAGAVREGGRVRVVRPLVSRYQQGPVRNVGWSPFLLDGHTRWEVFELLTPTPAEPQPPHLEDLWVRALRSRRRTAPPAERRAILEATAAAPDQPLFGVALETTRAAAFAQPGMGQRSLATLMVPGNKIAFTGSWRDGVAEPDIRVSLPLPELGERQLPVKDHHLLARAEAGSASLEQRLRRLNEQIARMGERVAVRLGLSRGFRSNPGRAPAVCWLMADGFFSLADPQS